MGLGHAFLAELIELRRCGALDRSKLRNAPRIVEIGSQQLSDNFLRSNDLLDEVYQMFGRDRPHLGEPVGPENFTEAAPASRTFWQSLGFDYAAIDYDGHRDSTAIDLNRDGVPDHMRGAFDLVVNAGTTEHIANQDNAFRVIHDLCGKGGVMHHEVPAGGLMEHGLINYNLRFFWNLSAFNVYRIVSLKVCSSGSSPIPESLRESNLLHGGGVDHITVAEVPDFTIRASFQKLTPQAFASPLDVPPSLLPFKDGNRSSASDTPSRTGWCGHGVDEHEGVTPLLFCPHRSLSRAPRIRTRSPAGPPSDHWWMTAPGTFPTCR
jgi:hypothetical protein